MHSRKYLPGLALALLGVFTLLLSGCYALRGSSGSGRTDFQPPRTVNPADIALPEGYHIDTVATGLNFPTGVAFDALGRVYVTESGYSYGEVFTTPRLLRLDRQGIAEIAVGDSNGPWTGLDIAGSFIYVAEGGVLHGGRILKIHPDGTTTVLVDSLPSMGDHHTNGPVVKGDWVYFGQGSATNSGIVGADNADFGWLKRHPEFHDIPGEDVVLQGENFVTKNLMDTRPKRVSTGAYLPYGTPSHKGQLVRGALPCTGSVMRVHTDGTGLELVAWGFRNPFGLAFSPDGRLFATENGYDERGNRPVFGASDCLWDVEIGTWYGWPDYSAGQLIDNPGFDSPRGPRPTRLIAGQPNEPPKPVATFAAHSSADGFDFSRSDSLFGYAGQAFVAQFGDQAPTRGKILAPIGCKLVRVDPATGLVEEFAVNRGRLNGPASKIGGGGFERPIAARFDPKGEALYVVDFGVLLESKHGTLPQQETGVLWKITRTAK